MNKKGSANKLFFLLIVVVVSSLVVSLFSLNVLYGISKSNSLLGGELASMSQVCISTCDYYGYKSQKCLDCQKANPISTSSTTSTSTSSGVVGTMSQVCISTCDYYGYKSQKCLDCQKANPILTSSTSSTSGAITLSETGEINFPTIDTTGLSSKAMDCVRNVCNYPKSEYECYDLAGPYVTSCVENNCKEPKDCNNHYDAAVNFCLDTFPYLDIYGRIRSRDLYLKYNNCLLPYNMIYQECMSRYPNYAGYGNCVGDCEGYADEETADEINSCLYNSEPRKKTRLL
jgi:hypothetical protein